MISFTLPTLFEFLKNQEYDVAWVTEGQEFIERIIDEEYGQHLIIHSEYDAKYLHCFLEIMPLDKIGDQAVRGCVASKLDEEDGKTRNIGSHVIRENYYCLRRNIEVVDDNIRMQDKYITTRSYFRKYVSGNELKVDLEKVKKLISDCTNKFKKD